MTNTSRSFRCLGSWSRSTASALGCVRDGVNFLESDATAMHDLREIGPTFVLLAPRVLEQIAADMRPRDGRRTDHTLDVRQWCEERR